MGEGAAVLRLRGGGGVGGGLDDGIAMMFSSIMFIVHKSQMGGGGVRGRGVNGGHAHPAPIVQLCFNVHIQSKLL